jgi:hypothetical protein
MKESLYVLAFHNKQLVECLRTTFMKMSMILCPICRCCTMPLHPSLALSLSGPRIAVTVGMADTAQFLIRVVKLGSEKKNSF